MKVILAAAVSLALVGCAAGPPAAVAPAPSRTIAINADVSGLITRADPRLRDSSAYQLFRFKGSAGQIVQIDLMSSEFDAFLILQDSTGKELTHDDDSGGGTNARIIATLPYTGTFEIVANSYRAGQYGHYTLRMKGIGMASENIPTSGVLPGTVGQILRGQTVTGTLTPDSPQLTDSSVYQAWTFVGHEGESIQVDVVSSDFDAYGIIQDGNGVKLAEDDDSGGGTNARIIFTLPYTGAYRLVANTYRKGSFGAFQMSVR
jgi:hypothetical protein